MKKLRIAFVGHGLRGKSILSTVLKMKDIEVVAVCDAYEDRTREMVDNVVENGGIAPIEIPDFTDGKWIEPNEGQECKYSLDKICSDAETPIYPE